MFHFTSDNPDEWKRPLHPRPRPLRDEQPTLKPPPSPALYAAFTPSSSVFATAWMKSGCPQGSPSTRSSSQVSSPPPPRLLHASVKPSRLLFLQKVLVSGSQGIKSCLGNSSSRTDEIQRVRLCTSSHLSHPHSLGACRYECQQAKDRTYSRQHDPIRPRDHRASEATHGRSGVWQKPSVRLARPHGEPPPGP